MKGGIILTRKTRRRGNNRKKNGSSGSGVILAAFLIVILIILGKMASTGEFYDIGQDQLIPTAVGVEGEQEEKDNKLIDESQLDPDIYPERLIELYRKNNETAEFVIDYPNHIDENKEIDISKDVENGKIPLFIQWDKRWGYRQYGNDFLALTGCGPTCLSMVYCGLTGTTDMNPYVMAKKAEDEGYYVEGTGSSWNIMTKMATELGLSSRQLSLDKERIYKELNADHPVICIMGPGDFTDSGHFIVLTGIASNDEVIVNDPNSKVNSSKSWPVDTIMSQTKNLWSFQF